MPPQFTAFLRNTPNMSGQRLEFRWPVGTKQSGQLKVSKAQGPGSPAHPHCDKQPSYPVLGRPAVICLCPRPRQGPRRQAGPDDSREARLRSWKAAAPPGWALERATGGCAEARRGRGGPPRCCSALRGKERWGDEGRERGTGERPKRGAAARPRRPPPGGTHRPDAAAAYSCVPTGAVRSATREARRWRRRPDVTTGGGPFGEGRGGARALPGRAGSPDCGSIRDRERAGQPDRKVRSGACPALQARPVAAARHWAPGAARRCGPGLAPTRSSGRGRRALQRDRGRGRLGSLPARRHRLGAPAAATGAEPPRDRPQSRFA